jgi:hypothetical protein
MIVLRRLVVAVVIVAVLQGLKWLLDSYSPESLVFHREFLWSLQVLVIAWFLVTAALSIFRKENSWTARFVPVFLLMITIVTDMWFSHLITHPEKISASMLPVFREHYEQTEAKDLRYEPCTVYDSVMGCRIMRALGFTFGNIEYNNEYRVNSESLRDTEDDLFGPAIICSGNTFTLGCGVDANQTFAERFGIDAEKTAVNGGVINLGTANQLRYLNSIDTSVLEYLVVQYSFDDGESNSAFLQGSDTVYSEASFELKRKQYHWAREYFPGKHAVMILSDVVGRWFSKPDNELSQAAQSAYASALVKVLAKVVPNSRYRVIITHIDKRQNMNSGFIKQVDSLLRTEEFQSALPQATTVDLSGVLSEDDYYRLDMHLKPSGHEKIAGRLWDKFVELEK